MKKILIVIIIILLIILGFKMFNKSNEKYTRQDILTLIEKDIEYNNIYIKKETTLMNIHDGKVVEQFSEELKFRDNIGIKITYRNPMIWYVDYENNEAMQFYPDDKTRVVSSTDLEIKHPQFDYIEAIKNFEYSYDFVAEEKYKDKDCIIFEMSKEKSKTKFWVDYEGIIQKIEIYTKDNVPKKWIKYLNIEYETKFDELTNQDMEIPDISEYVLTDVFGNPI